MNEETRNRIIHRFEQGASKVRIARETGVSARTVGRVVEAARLQRDEPEASVSPARGRRSPLDAFEPRLKELLARYPNLTAVRALEELRRDGFAGGYTALRLRMKQLRPGRSVQPVVRFETGPGAQAQMDYSVHDIDFVREGRRRVYLFSYILGYSRRQYLRFVLAQDFATTVREHIRAFEYLGGAAAVCLYDNMKTVVVGHDGAEPIYNPRFLAFATHYGFRPWACRPRRPQTKGKVERPFRYAEGNLLNGRTFQSVDHLNETTADWLANVADVRKHGETGERPIDRHARELPHLLPLPANRYNPDPVVYRAVDAEGFIAWRGNSYSVPWRYIGSMLPVRIGEAELMVYSPRLDVVARHGLFPRHESGRRREEREHRPAHDRNEQREAIRQRFDELGPAAARFWEGLAKTHRFAKDQGRRVLALLANYHADDLQAALERAVRFGAFTLAAVERILAAQARPKSLFDLLADEQRDHLQPLLGNDPVGPRPTSDYQHLLFEEPADNDPPHETGADSPDEAP